MEFDISISLTLGAIRDPMPESGRRRQAAEGRLPSIPANQRPHPTRLCARRARSPMMSAKPRNTVARIIATSGCRQRKIGEKSENSLSHATNAMSAEANIHNTQYKPQVVNRAAAANEAKYVVRGDIDPRLPTSHAERKCH